MLRSECPRGSVIRLLSELQTDRKLPSSLQIAVDVRAVIGLANFRFFIKLDVLSEALKDSKNAVRNLPTCRLPRKRKSGELLSEELRCFWRRKIYKSISNVPFAAFGLWKIYKVEERRDCGNVFYQLILRVLARDVANHDRREQILSDHIFLPREFREPARGWGRCAGSG